MHEKQQQHCLHNTAQHASLYIIGQPLLLMDLLSYYLKVIAIHALIDPSIWFRELQYCATSKNLLKNCFKIYGVLVYALKCKLIEGPITLIDIQFDFIVTSLYFLVCKRACQGIVINVWSVVSSIGAFLNFTSLYGFFFILVHFCLQKSIVLTTWASISAQIGKAWKCKWGDYTTRAQFVEHDFLNILMFCGHLLYALDVVVAVSLYCQVASSTPPQILLFLFSDKCNKIFVRSFYCKYEVQGSAETMERGRQELKLLQQQKYLHCRTLALILCIFIINIRQPEQGARVS